MGNKEHCGWESSLSRARRGFAEGGGRVETEGEEDEERERRRRRGLSRGEKDERGKGRELR